MVIDFHTHIFPDKIAEKTLELLIKNSGSDGARAYGKATFDAIKSDMKKNGIDISVILPVATSVKQVASINRSAAELNGSEGIIYFGAIHPECDNVAEVLDGIKSSGLKGIKIHPDYQNERFDSPAYINIMKEAAERDLITVTHAGVDVGYRDNVHCTPDMVLKVLGELSGIIDNKLVLAHMGGCDMPDEVMEKLVGKPVYFDTSFVLSRYSEKSKEIILKHGADKILFATDYPWSDGKEFIEIIKSYALSKEDTDKILFKNALALLN